MLSVALAKQNATYLLDSGGRVFRVNRAGDPVAGWLSFRLSIWKHGRSGKRYQSQNQMLAMSWSVGREGLSSGTQK